MNREPGRIFEYVLNSDKPVKRKCPGVFNQNVQIAVGPIISARTRSEQEHAFSAEGAERSGPGTNSRNDSVLVHVQGIAFEPLKIQQ